MKLRLSENPKEWRKAALVWTAALAAAAVLLAIRGRVTQVQAVAAIAGLAALGAASWIRPALFRPVYRFVMTITFYVGQFVGRVLLVVFFLIAVTPLALLLRLMGKDLLKCRRPARETSYWRPAPALGDLRKLF